jgi:hypothetical protein
MASFHTIPRIVSEDENASLLGVGAVVYPSVMKASKEMLRIGGEEFFIGAGSWRLDEDMGPKKDNPHVDNFNHFMNLVYSGIDAELYDGEKEREAFKKNRDEFLDLAYRTNILGQNVFDLKYMKKQIRYTPLKPYETRSFVLHVPFDKGSTRKIVTELGDIEDVIVGTGTGAFKLKDILLFKHQK